MYTFTVSIHAEKNYPFRKVASDFDIGLTDNAGDGEYLNAVSNALDYIKSKRPDFIFYIAGADPYYEDSLGRLAVSKKGLADRDRKLLSYFLKMRYLLLLFLEVDIASQL